MIGQYIAVAVVTACLIIGIYKLYTMKKPKAKIPIFNNEEPITHDKAKNYQFKKLIATATAQDNIDKFTILGYEENKQERQKNKNRHKRHKNGLV